MKIKRKILLPFILCTLLLAGFALLGIYGMLFAPAEEDISERENRTLAARPVLTLPGFLSGEYAEQLESYLLDRFWQRDALVRFTQNIRSTVSLAGYDDLMNYKLASFDDEAGVDPALLQDETEPSPDAPSNAKTPQATTKTPAPTQPSTLTEAAAPTGDAALLAPSAASPAPGTAAVSALTRAPLPEKTHCTLDDIERTIGLYMDVGTDRVRLRAFNRSELPPIVDILNAYAAELPEYGRLILASIPVSYYGSMLLRTDGASAMVSTIDPAIEALTSDSVRTVSATQILSSAALAGEYVYFRTDNHCTPYGTYLWYSAIVRAAGYEPTPQESFAITREDPFLGTFYRDDPSKEMRENADVLEKWLPPHSLEFRRYTAPDTYDVLPLFWENANPNDRYTVCLGGTGGAWNTMVNLDRTDGDNCLVVSDSFGPVAVTMLSGQYKEVHFIDPRYFKKDVAGGSVAELIEKYRITDCYFLLSVNWLFGEDSYIKIAGRRLY